jgi:hypothetical protein
LGSYYSAPLGEHGDGTAPDGYRVASGWFRLNPTAQSMPVVRTARSFGKRKLKKKKIIKRLNLEEFLTKLF